MIIKQKLANSTNYSNRDNSKIQFLVIHYTGNKNDKAISNANYFQSPNRNASAHYFVDDDEVYQSVLDDKKAWHCGHDIGGQYYHKTCRNSNSIGIEMCTKFDTDYYISEKTQNNTIKLAKTLMLKYNIPIDNIIRHYDVTHKSCPRPFVDNAKWKSFKDRLKEVDEVVTQTRISVNGELRKVNTIFKDGNNYIKLRDLESDDIDIMYDEVNKIPIINTKKL